MQDKKNTPLNDQIREIKQLAVSRHYPLAEEKCRTLLKENQQEIQLWQLLFNILYQQRKFATMIKDYEKHKGSFIDSIPLLSLYANALRYNQNGEKAVAVLEEYLSNHSPNALLLNQQGLIYKELGKKINAIQCFTSCLKIAPGFSQAYWNKTGLAKQLSKCEFEDIKEQLGNEQISAENQIYLHYTLFVHYDSCQQYVQAFEHLKIGADLMRSRIDYNHEQALIEFQSIQNSFDKKLITQADKETERITTNYDNKSSPIFIVGMPRSGTTLVEQIISSHSEVTAGDETLAFAQATQLTLQNYQIKTHLADWVKSLNSEHWQSIENNYLQLTQTLHQTSNFTDKTLLNFKAIGMILTTFPDAKIIDCRRDPMDNVFSCYKQLFASGLNFTYDLNELADQFNAYHKLMEHWQHLFPEKIITLKYESLVDNQEIETRRLLNFLGLSFDEKCLAYYQNDRSVHTLSANQVKQPIYRSSIESWKNYQEFLAPLQKRFK